MYFFIVLLVWKLMRAVQAVLASDAKCIHHVLSFYLFLYLFLPLLFLSLLLWKCYNIGAKHCALCKYIILILQGMDSATQMLQ